MFFQKRAPFSNSSINRFRIINTLEKKQNQVTFFNAEQDLFEKNM